MVTSGPVVGQFVSVALAGLGVGMLGMGLGDLLGGDDAESDEDEGESGGDDFFDDDGMDDLDGMDEFDDGGLDEDLGEGGDVDELEQRVGELEDEVASISSTVSTVRSENEEISEAVDDIEENVRNLLDIYEMVTRGVNPFVDDVQPGGGPDGGEFGLFDDDGGDEEEDVDDEVAEADAEEFFDDDLLDDDGEDDDSFAVGHEDEDPFGEADEGDEGGEGGEADDLVDDADDEPLGESDDGEDGDDGGGTTFSDLKEEYESGEADWADDVEIGEDEGDDVAAEPDAEDDVAAEPDAEDDVAAEPDAEDDEPDQGDEGSDALFDGDGDDVGGLLGESDAVDGEGGSTGDGGTATDDPSGGEDASDRSGADDCGGSGVAADAAAGSDGGSESGRAGGDPTASAFEFGTVEDRADGESGGERPYLPTLPAGLRTDATAMAWLSYLVERGGHGGAVDALRYYRRIGWIGPAAEEGLRTLLGGVGSGDAGAAGTRVRAEADGGVAGLGPEEHRRSLQYIGRLSDVPTDRLLARTGGDRDGIQR